MSTGIDTLGVFFSHYNKVKHGYCKFGWQPVKEVVEINTLSTG